MQVFDVVEWFIKYYKSDEQVNGRVYDIMHEALIEYVKNKPRIKEEVIEFVIDNTK